MATRSAITPRDRTPIGEAACWLTAAACFIVSFDLAVNSFAAGGAVVLVQAASAAVAFVLVGYLVLTGAATFGGAGRGTSGSRDGGASRSDADRHRDTIIDLRDGAGIRKPVSSPEIRRHAALR